MTGRSTDAQSRTLANPLRQVAISNTKERSESPMAESSDRGGLGCKGKKKTNKKRAPQLLDEDTPELSVVVDIPSLQEECINKEQPSPSQLDRRIEDVVRFKLACEEELKLLERRKAEKAAEINRIEDEWCAANSLYRNLLAQRSGFLGDGGIIAAGTLVPLPKKRKIASAVQSDDEQQNHGPDQGATSSSSSSSSMQTEGLDS